MNTLTRLQKLAVYLHLADAHDGTLSLTSIALWVVIVKLAILSSYGLPDLSALLLALAAYAGKKVLFTQVAKRHQSDRVSQLEKSLAEVSDKVAILNTQKGLLAMGGKR